MDVLISLGNLEQITEILDSPQSRAFQLSFWASMGTFLGGLLVILIIRVYPQKSFSKLMGILQSLSAGVMLFITCFHLVPESVEEIGSRQTMIWFFVGVAAFGVLEYFMHDLDHHDHQEDAVETKQEAPRTPMKQKASKPVKSSEKETKEAKQMAKTLAMTFIALFLHNLPEGLGVYLSSLSNARVVIEGMAVAIPLYISTKSEYQVLKWTFLNGLAEPIGVIIGGVFLQPYLNAHVLSACLAAVGGVMMCVCIVELLPTSYEYAGKTRASAWFFVGMLLCWLALEGVDILFDGHGHSHSHGPGEHSHHAFQQVHEHVHAGYEAHAHAHLGDFKHAHAGHHHEHHDHAHHHHHEHSHAHEHHNHALP